MATEIISGQLGEIRAASTAGGGTALTTTAGYIQLPYRSSHIFITPRNFATAVVVKFALNPWLAVLKTSDNMVSVPTDYSKIAQDASTSTDVGIGGLSTLANGDFLLVGAPLPFRGAYADVDTASTAAASTLTVAYWNGVGWTDASATDGSSDATRPFANDGLVYWTVPAAGLWQVAKIKDLYPTVPAFPDYYDVDLFWTRWVVSVAVTATATLNSLVAANRSTAYAELLSGQLFEAKIHHGPMGIGCVEALTDAGTANLIVNVATLRDGRYE